MIPFKIGTVEPFIHTDVGREPGDSPERGMFPAPRWPQVGKYTIPIHTFLAKNVVAVWYQPKSRLQDLDGFQLIEVLPLDKLHVAINVSAATAAPKRAQIKIFIMYEEDEERAHALEE